MKSYVWQDDKGGLSEFAADDVFWATQVVDRRLEAAGHDVPCWAEEPVADGTNDDGEDYMKLHVWGSVEDWADGKPPIGQLIWLA